MYQSAIAKLHRTELVNTHGQSEWRMRIRELREGLEAIEAEMTGAPRTAAAIRDARAFIRARAQRKKFFDADLFSDPAWDILLELYASEMSQHRISVSKLCFAVNVPTTTVLRWLALLERQGLVVRQPDPMDGRRVWVSISPAGLEKMEGYFDSLA
jgi:DNA-binding MarR family transcriptional regulator